MINVLDTCNWYLNMQELSKTSFPRSRANDENSDNLSYLIEKKLEILSRLKTESASLEQLINTPSQENKVTELEQQIEEMDLKW